MNEALVRDFINAVKAENKKTSAYDTPATVTRIDGGTAWVHIPGGVDETPIKMTVNAKEGDIVQVRVADGRAWIVGNETAPPTDDAKANEADTKAAEAKYLAADAADAAIKADIAAQDAVASAEEASVAAQTAKEIAEGVEGIAEDAQESAKNASEYAARALGNLSTVQNVTETLTWITQHGTMALTTDVALDPTHVYFVQDAGGDYVVGGVTYAIVTEPDVADIGTYYELTIDESLNNYVGTHLALTSEGLWLLPASTGTNKVLIATGDGSVYTTAGTYIIDTDGTTVLASFRADGVTIGDILTSYLTINQHSIRYYDDGVALFELSGEDGVIVSGGHYSCVLGSSVSDKERSLTMLGDEWTGKTRLIRPQYDSQRYAEIYVDGVDVTNIQSTYNVYTRLVFYKEDYPNTKILLGWTQTTSVQLHLIDQNFDISFDADTGTTTIKNLGTSGTYHLFGEYPLSIRNLKTNIGGNDVNGNLGFALGFGCTANGYVSMALGHGNIAEGSQSFVTGISNEVWGDYSLVAGIGNVAYNQSTVAVGNGIEAKGLGSTVFGYETKSTRARETVIGKYNAIEAGSEFADGTNAFIIGNGNGDDSRSNALTVDWSGNVCMALDTTAASGTDHDLYAAIVALGWDSDVIV